MDSSNLGGRMYSELENCTMSATEQYLFAWYRQGHPKGWGANWGDYPRPLALGGPCRARLVATPSIPNTAPSIPITAPVSKPHAGWFGPGPVPCYGCLWIQKSIFSAFLKVSQAGKNLWKSPCRFSPSDRSEYKGRTNVRLIYPNFNYIRKE